ncbi:adhesion G-protein coupled receptor D1-like [Anneissia japonica]|uniref:adhesion G-protein coupled receptor D1-like n=1 Tax=Anneissia japonica TaxID=1529436 RepID=UPI0014258C54|nr:adhesion G-protein coupled receptor D1-like [Anneissia japonica]
MIHMQLMGHIIVFDILFLGAVDRTDNKNACIFVSVAMHFELLCIFMWMMSEAVFLVFKVVKKTPSRYNKFKFHFLVAYTVPILIVLTAVILGRSHYTAGDLCLLDGSGKWAVVIPMLGSVLINMIILLKMLIIIYSRAGPMTQKSEKLQTEYKQLRSTVKGVLMLVPILGVTWIIGPFAAITNSLFLIYLYAILNSLQGVFIFICYCLLDQKVSCSFVIFQLLFL